MNVVNGQEYYENISVNNVNNDKAITFVSFPKRPICCPPFVNEDVKPPINSTSVDSYNCIHMHGINELFALILHILYITMT